MSTATPQIIEHFVLFKVKPDADPSKVSAMVNGLNGLISLDQVIHLTAGAVLRTRSSSLAFTHLLHIRFNSKADLISYSVHPDHVSVVKESAPIVDDIMAIDWIADDLAGPVVPRRGSAMRVTFLKLKEGLGEKEKSDILRVIGGMKDGFESIDQFSFGENFSAERAKGFSMGWVAIFPGLNELDSNAELGNLQEEIEELLVLDYPNL